MAKTKATYHILALLTVTAWATTFVSSKYLLGKGLHPAEIFFLRFLLAYVSIIPFSFRRWWCGKVSHELLMLALGVTGGSAYFLFENTALEFTYAANVCLLVSSAPLLTALLSLRLARDEKPTKMLAAGSLIAFLGVSLVLAGDGEHMQLALRGDVLALMAALMWAFYQILMKRAFALYPATMITRKVFGYGLLTIAIYAFFAGSFRFPAEVLTQPDVVGNLLFLGIVASCICYLAWNVVIGKIGSVASANYIYLQPLIAAALGAMILGEPITLTIVWGAVLIISGVYLAERR